MPVGRTDYRDSVLSGKCGAGAIGKRDARPRRRARDHDVSASRGGARVYLRVQAAQQAGVEADFWALSAALSRQLPARSILARFRAAFAGMVCAEASGRRFCRDLCGLADPAIELAQALSRMGRDEEVDVPEPAG